MNVFWPETAGELTADVRYYDEGVVEICRDAAGREHK